MENNTKEKIKTEDILTEIDNLKKYTNQLSSNVRSEKLESFINIMDQNINNLQNETENFYNEKYSKEIEEESK